MFRLRGAEEGAAPQGLLAKAPAARLAVLPATAHLNILSQPDLIATLVTPLLDDLVPATPEGIF